MRRKHVFYKSKASKEMRSEFFSLVSQLELLPLGLSTDMDLHAACVLCLLVSFLLLHVSPSARGFGRCFMSSPPFKSSFLSSPFLRAQRWAGVKAARSSDSFALHSPGNVVHRAAAAFLAVSGGLFILLPVSAWVQSHFALAPVPLLHRLWLFFLQHLRSIIICIAIIQNACSAEYRGELSSVFPPAFQSKNCEKGIVHPP